MIRLEEILGDNRASEWSETGCGWGGEGWGKEVVAAAYEG